MSDGGRTRSQLICSVSSSRSEETPSSYGDIVYEPEYHTIRVVAGGQVAGHVVKQLGGFAYHPQGSHPLSCSSPPAKEVMALIEKELGQCGRIEQA